MTAVRPLPERKRVRHAWNGVRAGRPPVEGGGRASTDDAAILDLVATPYRSVDDAEQRLRDLEWVFRDRSDRRSIFLSIYARVTAEVATGIRRGDFVDPAWTGEYLVAFADLYRQALYDFETGDLRALADPWQIAFQTAASGDCLVVQDAALGINAHVNYDLALALCRAGIDPDRSAKYADHRAVNGILRRLVDETQDDLAERYAPGIADVDESLGRLDEYLSVLAITEGRDSAWRTAVAVTDSRVGIRARFARWVMRVTSTGAAHLITSSRAIDPLHDSLHGIEAGELDAEAATTDEGSGTETDS